MREVALVAGVRTAFARATKGALRDTRPDELGMQVLREVVQRAGISAEDIEDVVLGCAMPEGEQGMNVARLSALGAGFPDKVPAMTVNRFCASGLQSIAIIADRIALGRMEVGVAGGVESMSMIPMSGTKPSLSLKLLEQCPQAYTPMGLTAENVAHRFSVSRADQDVFALRSHQRALRAQTEGFFQEEIMPVEATVYEAEQVRTILLQKDEGPRADTSLEKLAALKPAFDAKGSVTAGNSSPLTDGAAAVVVMSKERALQRNRPVLGYFREFVAAGVPPEIMGVGPVFAIRALLQRVGLRMDQIDLFEINEAFASQALYCQRELAIPDDKLNVNGGAIALGHPLGVSGTRLVLTLLRELARRKARYGVVSMCVGGGMGAAALVEYAR